MFSRALTLLAISLLLSGVAAAVPVPTSAAPQKFLITPTSFDFGTQPLHSPSSQQTVTVTNVSGVPQQMSGVGGGAGVFGGVQDCQGVTIAAGASCQMSYAFTPSSLGPATATARGSWNGQSYTLHFHGIGTPEFLISPTGLDFGHVALGNAATQQQVAVTNLGAPVMMTGVGGAAGQFGGVQNCQGITLAHNASCSMSYQFTPTTIGDVVTTAGGTWNGQRFTIRFHGVGTGPAAYDYVPLNGHRLTTRTVGAMKTATAKVIGGDVPSDAKAVDLTVTVTGASAPGSLIAYPCGQLPAELATIQFRAGQAATNHVMLMPGTGGRICVRPTANSRVSVDLDGYFPAASGYRPVYPTVRRLQAGASHPVRPGSVTRVKVLGGVVPDSQVRAVALNLTAARAARAGQVTVWPCGTPSPSAAALSYPAGHARAALTVSKVGKNGFVCVRSTQRTALFVDVAGYYMTGTPFSAVRSQNAFDGTVGAGGVAKANVIGGANHIAGTARAVAVELTASGASRSGRLALFPCGTPAPATTVLSYSPGERTTSLAVTNPGTGGKVCVKASRQVHVSVAVVAWYSDVDAT
jgi:hypothetical protein